MTYTARKELLAFPYRSEENKLDRFRSS